MCRVAVTLNTSIGKADRHFERWGAVLLIVAEFIPASERLHLLWLAPGETVPPHRSCSTARSVPRYGPRSIWASGSVFSKEIDRVLDVVAQSGRAAIAAIAAAIAVYFAVKWWRRRRSIKASG